MLLETNGNHKPGRSRPQCRHHGGAAHARQELADEKTVPASAMVPRIIERASVET
jgi:hypothetical protein